MSDEPVPITPCCFCGKLDYSGADPTYLTVGTRSEVTKTWWCHIACFEARLSDLPKPWNVYDYEEIGASVQLIECPLSQLRTLTRYRILEPMRAHFATLMRASLWLLLAAAAYVSFFWLMLIASLGFDTWLTGSSAAGLILQGGLIFFPLGLFLGLRKSEGSFIRTSATFVTAWCIALGAVMFLQVWPVF